MRTNRPVTLILLHLLPAIACSRPPDPAPLTPAPVGTAPAEEIGDAGSFRITRVLDLHRNHVSRFEFSPEARMLFVAHAEPEHGFLHQWNVDLKKQVFRYDLGGEYICDHITASPDGHYLLVGCWPRKGYVCKTLILDVTACRVLVDLKETGRITDARWSPDSKAVWLATSDWRVAYDLKGGVVSWDPTDFADHRRLRPVESTMQTPTSRLDLYGEDGTIVWRLAIGHWHNNCGLTSDGRHLATTTWDGELLVWRVADRELVFHRKMTASYGYLAYDARYNRFLWADAMHNGTSWLMALEIPTGGVASQPAGVWEDPKRSIAHRELASFQESIGKRSVEDLMQLLKTPYDTRSGTDDVAYWTIRDRNSLIITELQRRLPGVRETLEKHRTDNDRVFTGTAGKDECVAYVCNRLLGRPERDGLPKHFNVDDLQAIPILEKMARSLPTKTPDELMTMLNPKDGGDTAVGYLVQEEGNRMIEQELKRRGAAAKQVLLQHKDDHTPLNTGPQGPYSDISELCRSLLEDLGEGQ
jgi:hypothetical protein